MNFSSTMEGRDLSEARTESQEETWKSELQAQVHHLASLNTHISSVEERAGHMGTRGKEAINSHS